MAEWFIYFVRGCLPIADCRLSIENRKSQIENALEVAMNDVMTPRGVESQKILQIAIEKRIPAIMSYLSKQKWHVAKVVLADLVGERLSIESMTPATADSSRRNRQRPINIRVGQPVGISFKYEYGKFVFDTAVVGLEPARNAEARGEGVPPSNRGQDARDANRVGGGTIVLAVPDKIEVVQRRSYFRVNVPESLKVQVLLWHRPAGMPAPAPAGLTDCGRIGGSDQLAGPGCMGRLVDISAGGAQVIVPHENSGAKGQEADFKKGQFVGVRFTPMPYETPLVLSAQIRNVLPTADGGNASLGLQIVGLEASPEGREILTRLIGVVEQYFQINQSGAKEHSTQPVSNAV
jgi:hypothetical protein